MPPAARTLDRLRTHAVAHLILLAAALYTLALATHLTFRFEHLRAMDHYRLQANGFAHGRLDLHDDAGAPVGPSTDTCNYKGKAYIGYGLLPAVFQLVVHHLVHVNVTSAAIVWVICLATLYVLYWIAFDVGQNILRMEESRAAVMAALLCAAVATTRQFLHEVVVPYSWSQAGATGQLFALLAVWMVVRNNLRRRALHVVLAGAFTGCAAFSKANYAFIAAPLLLWLVLDRPEGGARIASARRIVLQYGAPLTVIVACMMVVNQRRFENPFEIGFRYANGSELNPANWSLPQLHRIPYNFYNHFLAPFEYRSGDLPLLDGSSQRFGTINQADGSGGLLHNVPLFSAFLALPLLSLVPFYAVRVAFGRVRGRRLDVADRWWCFFVAVAVCEFAIYLTHDSSWLRYQYDFLFCTALAVFISLTGALCFLTGPIARSCAIAVVAVAALWQVAVGLDHALGLLFSRTQPFMYWDSAAWRLSDDRIGARVHRLRTALFAPDVPQRVFYETESSKPMAPRFTQGALWHIKDLGLWFESDGFEWIHMAGKWPGTPAVVTFSLSPQHAREPLYTVGTDARTTEWIGVRYDYVSSRSLGVTFYAAYWLNGKPCESARIEIVPDHPYRMRFLLDPTLSQVAVTLDEREVLYCRPREFTQERGVINLGKFASDGAATFSGTIELRH